MIKKFLKRKLKLKITIIVILFLNVWGFIYVAITYFPGRSNFDGSEYITMLRSDYNDVIERTEFAEAEVDQLTQRIRTIERISSELKEELEESQRTIGILQEERNRQRQYIEDAGISVEESIDTTGRIANRSQNAETEIREALNFISQLETGSSNTEDRTYSAGSNPYQ